MQLKAQLTPFFFVLQGENMVKVTCGISTAEQQWWQVVPVLLQINEGALSNRLYLKTSKEFFLFFF